MEIPAGGKRLHGTLTLPEGARSVVLFAYASGSSRHSARNQLLAEALARAGLGALLFDLLTPEEEAAEAYTRHLRFDIDLLAGRLFEATAWLVRREETRRLRAAFIGASTGAAAALAAAARLGEQVGAVVSGGGRPDLAAPMLALVTAPTLLIVGALDTRGLALNEQALAQLRCEKELLIVPGASQLFEEPGTFDQVAVLATEWFTHHLD